MTAVWKLLMLKQGTYLIKRVSYQWRNVLIRLLNSQDNKLVVVIQVQWDGCPNQTEVPLRGLSGPDILLVPVVHKLALTFFQYAPDSLPGLQKADTYNGNNKERSWWEDPNSSICKLISSWMLSLIACSDIWMFLILKWWLVIWIKLLCELLNFPR